MNETVKVVALGKNPRINGNNGFRESIIRKSKSTIDAFFVPKFSSIPSISISFYNKAVFKNNI